MLFITACRRASALVALSLDALDMGIATDECASESVVVVWITEDGMGAGGGLTVRNDWTA